MLDLSLALESQDILDNALAAILEETTAAALSAKADRLRAALTLQFATEGRAFFTPWAPRKHFDPFRGILVSTGRLRDSLTMLGGEHLEEISAEPASLLFGTRVPYAAPLHYGTPTMPARPILSPEVLRA